MTDVLTVNKYYQMVNLKRELFAKRAVYSRGLTHGDVVACACSQKCSVDDPGDSDQVHPGKQF